jgi:hypothetical protein
MVHKNEVETSLVFELSLVGVTGMSADFTPVNIAPTTNQVFSNHSTSTHTIHKSSLGKDAVISGARDVTINI